MCAVKKFVVFFESNESPHYKYNITNFRATWTLNPSLATASCEAFSGVANLGCVEGDEKGFLFSVTPGISRITVTTLLSV